MHIESELLYLIFVDVLFLIYLFYCTLIAFVFYLAMVSELFTFFKLLIYIYIYI